MPSSMLLPPPLGSCMPQFALQPTCWQGNQEEEGQLWQQCSAREDDLEEAQAQRWKRQCPGEEGQLWAVEAQKAQRAQRWKQQPPWEGEGQLWVAVPLARGSTFAKLWEGQCLWQLWQCLWRIWAVCLCCVVSSPPAYRHLGGALLSPSTTTLLLCHMPLKFANRCNYWDSAGSVSPMPAP